MTLGFLVKTFTEGHLKGITIRDAVRVSTASDIDLWASMVGREIGRLRESNYRVERFEYEGWVAE